jgi:hypothetical protein
MGLRVSECVKYSFKGILIDIPPFSKWGIGETPQQRLWGIENLIKKAGCFTLPFFRFKTLYLFSESFS